MQLHTTSDSINTTADVVKMKNGDRLTGEILRVRRGQLYFDSDIPGDVTIDLKDIKSLIGRMNIYRM
jgi:hypothetical protein